MRKVFIPTLLICLMMILSSVGVYAQYFSNVGSTTSSGSPYTYTINGAANAATVAIYGNNNSFGSGTAFGSSGTGYAPLGNGGTSGWGYNNGAWHNVFAPSYANTALSCVYYGIRESDLSCYTSGSSTQYWSVNLGSASSGTVVFTLTTGTNNNTNTTISMGGQTMQVQFVFRFYNSTGGTIPVSYDYNSNMAYVPFNQDLKVNVEVDGYLSANCTGGSATASSWLPILDVFNASHCSNNTSNQINTNYTFNFWAPNFMSLPTASTNASPTPICSGGTSTLTAWGVEPGGQALTLPSGNTNAYATIPGSVLSSTFGGTSKHFTMEGWVYMRSYQNWSRLFDFGNTNGNGLNCILIALTAGTSGYPVFATDAGSSGSNNQSSIAIPLNQWTHVAAVYDGANAYLYVNGVLGVSAATATPVSTTRSNWYIGRSNWNGYSYADAIFDNIRIWNTNLSQATIQANMYKEITTATANLVCSYVFNGNTYSTYNTGTLNEAISGANPMSIYNSVTYSTPALLNYTWTGTGAPSSSTNQAQTTSALTGPTTINYTVQTKACNVNSSASANTPVTVYAPFSVGTLSSPGGTICTNGTPSPTSVSITPSGGSGSYNFSWTATNNCTSTTATQTNNNVASASYTIPSGSLNCQQTYVVSVTDATNSACGSNVVSNTVSQTVYPTVLAPTPTTTAPTTGICNGSGTTLTATGLSPSVNALKLVTGSSQYAALPAGVYFTGGSFSIEGWVYLNSYQNWSRLMDFGNGSGVNNVLVSVSSNGVSGQPWLEVYGASSSLGKVYGGTIPLNTWTHLACVFVANGASSTGYILSLIHI